MINAFVTHMKEIGWDIVLNEKQDNDIPKTLTDRYANIPQEWLEYVKSVKHMVSPDETTWVLGAEDFEVQGDKAFQWNEWELMSLESAGNDEEWKRSIGKFWNQHLPDCHVRKRRVFLLCDLHGGWFRCAGSRAGV